MSIKTEIRISRYLAKAGLASRREAEKLILDGRVTLNGNTVSEPWRNCRTTDILKLDGTIVSQPTSTALYKLHKPRGYLSTSKDAMGRKTIFDGITTDDLDSLEYQEFKKKHFSKSEDVITSRIMWLKGNEHGINLGGDVDTYNRYIYIHGTIHENKIGKKDSHGCIRMNNDDVIELFDNVKINMIVHII